LAKRTGSSADSITAIAHKVIIFGEGPLSRRRNSFFKELKRPLQQCDLEKSANEVELKVSTLGSEAGAVGAARLISENALDRLYPEN
jgi:predicted NBD/HSP70 family sugar kinase